MIFKFKDAEGKDFAFDISEVMYISKSNKWNDATHVPEEYIFVATRSNFQFFIPTYDSYETLIANMKSRD